MKTRKELTNLEFLRMLQADKNKTTRADAKHIGNCIVITHYLKKPISKPLYNVITNQYTNKIYFDCKPIPTVTIIYDA